MPFVPVGVLLKDERDGWVATVTVNDTTATVHRVRISRAEHERYGGGDVTDLVRRSFEFLLARETNTQVLREFALSDIEKYFPDFARTIRS
jgi:hypothetical protein